MNGNEFSVVPLEVIQDKRLTLEQVRVLVALFSFRNKSTNTIWPSRTAIAERTCVHPSNISEATTALAKLGWLTKEGKGGFSKSTRYTLTTPDLSELTIAQKATVADSATVAQSATRGIADSATSTVAQSATRTEQSIEQSIEQSNSAAPTAPPPALADKQKKSSKPKADDAQDTELQAACKATWAAYSGEYRTRYGIDPVRNAKVNSNVKEFVKRIGHDEAPGVARFYVERVSEAFVIRGYHALGTLLQNAEAYRTQWATGQAMTSTRAQQADKTQSNFDSAQQAKAMLRARREARNAE